ncbi:Transport protein particle (TRAPP) component [Carpediemonas membranifera]|uniref:Trafficking protein particle complex subunit n=1 Tax=Carpediemonas membranifera TaxID=201153 RepID=A0A8J6AS39_9EUKA|nr:Transport protein particle (TRAPP) component [Carpediemonas membranifera]|eukprot:KAG9393016.1 Transport protein particle (TRAPP) component [Carpediemonas membranifera]
MEKTLKKGRPDIAMSSFSFLFAEMLNYFHSRASSSDELEGRLQAAGERLGLKVLELMTYREKANRKDTLESFLSFISNNVWRMLFGRPADGLQRIPADNSYMILESVPITNRYIEAGQLNPATFITGIIIGMLRAAGFNNPVETHVWKKDESTNETTNVYLVKSK